MTATVKPQPSIAERAAMGVGWIVAWRVATRNIGLLNTLILVRLLQPTDFGLVALAGGFINSVDALSAIGVQDALIRAPSLNRDLYDTGFGLSLLRGLLTSALIAAIAWPVGHFFNDPRLTVVMLALSAGTVISAFENIGIVNFRRDMAFRKEFDMQLWSRIAGVMMAITTAAIWHTYWALVAGILTFRVGRLVQSYVLSTYRPSFTLRAWRSIIGFSLWSWGQTMVGQVRDRSEGIAIGRLLGTEQVGVFSVGLEIGSLPITELVEPLCRALFSGFASLQNTAEGLAKMFVGAVGLGWMLILPAGVGISMIADPMVRVSLGEHWVSAVPIVQIMAIGGITSIITLSCGTLLNAVGRPHEAFYVGIAATLVKIVALVLMVPAFGLLGAAGAIVVSSLIDLLLLLFLTLPRIGVMPWRLVAAMVRPLLATGAMVATLWHFGMAWTPTTGDTVLTFGLDAGRRSATGAACYVVALVGLWFAAGRPDGAERYTLTMLQNLWRRFLPGRSAHTKPV